MKKNSIIKQSASGSVSSTRSLSSGGTNTVRNAKTGQFGGRPIGLAKAKKFALVEGIVLSEKTSHAIERFRSQGLKGDALRDALNSEHFKKKA